MKNNMGSFSTSELVVIGAFAALVLMAIVCIFRDRAQRTAQMTSFAASRGWKFTDKDPDHLGKRINAYFPRQVFTIYRSVAVEDATRTIHVFDCQHHYFNHTKSIQDRTGCIIESPRFRRNGAGSQPVEILYQYGTDALYGYDQFPAGSPGFAKEFVLSAKDQAVAKNVITPQLEDLLLRFRETAYGTVLSVGISETGAVAMAARSSSDEGMLELIELCRNIEAAMP